MRYPRFAGMLANFFVGVPCGYTCAQLLPADLRANEAKPSHGEDRAVMITYVRRLQQEVEEIRKRVPIGQKQVTIPVASVETPTVETGPAEPNDV